MPNHFVEELASPIAIDLGDGVTATVTHKIVETYQKGCHGRIEAKVIYGVVDADDNFIVPVAKLNNMFTGSVEGVALDDGANGGLLNAGSARGRYWPEDAVAAAGIELPVGG